MKELISWWPLLGTLINLCVLWVAWTIRQVAARELRDATGDIDRQIDGHDERLTRIEERMDHMPTHADMATLSQGVGDLRSEVRELGAHLAGLREASKTLTAQVTRIHEYLLDASRQKGP